MKNTFIALTLVTVLSTLFPAVSATASDREFQSFDVGAGGTLTLDSQSGSLDISSHTKNTVDVIIENKSSDNGLTVQFSQSGNDISIVGERDKQSGWGWNWGWSSSNVSIIIKVPQKYNLDLKTGGGSIRLADLTGEVKAHTSGGSIKLGKIVGDVQIKTSGGSIRVDEVAGNIDAHTSGGSIKATITKQPTANCRLTTSGGSVTAYLAADIAVDLVASTSGGSVSSDFNVDGHTSKRSIEGEINGGGPELLLRTSGGSVRVKEI